MKKNKIILLICIMLTCSLSIYTNNNVEQLFNAVNNEDINKVKSLIEENPDLVNMQDKKGKTALHIAFTIDNEDMVKLLIKKGGDLDIKDKKGKTPIDVLKKSRIDNYKKLKEYAKMKDSKDIDFKHHSKIVPVKIKYPLLFAWANKVYIYLKDKDEILNLVSIYKQELNGYKFYRFYYDVNNKDLWLGFYLDYKDKFRFVGEAEKNLSEFILINKTDKLFRLFLGGSLEEIILYENDVDTKHICFIDIISEGKNQLSSKNKYSLVNLFDQDNSTSFNLQADKKDLGIYIQFNKPTDVSGISIINGHASDLNEYKKKSRIKSIIIRDDTLSRNIFGPSQKIYNNFTLKDNVLGYQTFKTRFNEFYFKIEITDYYPGDMTEEKSISELNIKTEQHGWLFGGND